MRRLLTKAFTARTATFGVKYCHRMIMVVDISWLPELKMILSGRLFQSTGEFVAKPRLPMKLVRNISNI